MRQFPKDKVLHMLISGYGGMELYPSKEEKGTAWIRVAFKPCLGDIAVSCGV